MADSDKKLRAFLKQNKPKEEIVLKFSKAKMSRLKASSKPGEEVKDHVRIGMLAATFSIPSTKSGKFKAAKKRLRADDSLLPDSWRNDTVPTPKDEADKAKYYKKVDLNPTKYNLATRPQSQKSCGSCFAFACATTISDAFVFGKNLSYNPLNSPLDIMSCVTDGSNDKCDGGNPLGVLSFLADNKGIASSHCISYDNWASGEKLASDNVPVCAGCYIKQCTDPKPKPNRYKIKAPVFIASNDAKSDDGHLIDGVGGSTVHEIKLHLLNHGSAVVGFAVLNNFLSDPDGSYHETNGIYFENKIYDHGKSNGDTKGAEKTKGDDPFICVGGHAVCITGWGISAKPITLYYPNDNDPNKKQITIQNCPYWVVRNSWGIDWGDGGYFKMAMYQQINQDGVDYEVNPNVSFERFRSYSAKMLDADGKVTTQDMPIGGVIMIEADEIIPDTQDPRDAPPYTNEDMKKFYCSDTPIAPQLPSPSPSSSPSPTSSTSPSNGDKGKLQAKLKSNLGSNSDSSQTSSSSFWIILFIISVLIAIFIYIYRKYYKK